VGRATTAEVSVPVKLRAAAILNQTENKVRESVSSLSPLIVTLKPYETVTLRIEIETAP
jgi:hypothetical protein